MMNNVQHFGLIPEKIYSEKNKTADEPLQCFKEFPTAEKVQAVKLVYSNNAKDFKVAITACGIRHDKSIPNVPQTNGISEAAIESARQGTSSCLG